MLNMIIDTHAHYDEEAFDADRDEFLTSLPSFGIGAVVNVGASMEGARESVSYARHYEHVYCAVGLHPDHVGLLEEKPEETMEELCTLAQDPKCVAIGEIGLDYYWHVESRDIQKKWFAKQMELSRKLNLPINVHSRDAAADTLALVREVHEGGPGGIIHCFSGSVEMAKEYVKMGYYIGVGGVVTFRNAKTLQHVVEEIPLEYLVTETDCPYLAPVPYRGKRNRSDYLPLVVEKIAQIKGIENEQAERALFENAGKVYGKINIPAEYH